MKTINQHIRNFHFTVIGLCITAAAALAQQAVQPAYPSATEASQSLFQAVHSNNEQAIANILGGPTELTTSSNPSADKADRELFVEKYQEMHRLIREADGSVVLTIGAENWPFPVPLVSKNGVWRFDPDAGKQEVLLRQIGENELLAITNCLELVDAEKHYNPQSADSGTRAPDSLVAKAASGSAGGDPVLLEGYYYRLLPAPQSKGGKAAAVLIAYPAEYRSSGVMTFVVTKDGTVYEKDLGANTTTLASTMAVFHKDSSWRLPGE